MIGQIGCRTHDYGRFSLEVLAKQMAEDGYKTTQLALKKALPGMENLEDKLTDQVAKAIKKGMADQNINISVLGAYLNYGHPEDKVRKDNLDLLKGHLKIAKKIGARMVGTETGSLDPGYKPHPDNHGEDAYLRFKDAILEVMPLAHRFDTYMAVEPVAHHIIHTPDRMDRLVKDIDDLRLQVIFDINNMLTPDNYQVQDQWIRQMFDVIGHKITVLHLKDFDIVDGKKVIVPLGEGLLNIELLIELAKNSAATVDLLVENIPTNLLKKTYEFMKEVV